MSKAQERNEKLEVKKICIKQLKNFIQFYKFSLKVSLHSIVVPMKCYGIYEMGVVVVGKGCIR